LLPTRQVFANRESRLTRHNPAGRISGHWYQVRRRVLPRVSVARLVAQSLVVSTGSYLSRRLVPEQFVHGTFLAQLVQQNATARNYQQSLSA
jgi:hypothetical protein